MTSKKLNFRNFAFISLSAVSFLFLIWTLYSAQIIYGSEYTAQSERKQIETQRVEVARGSILDRYGRVLVSNQVIYELELHYQKVGNDVNSTIEWLIQTADAQEIPWETSLTISDSVPYHFTSENVFYGTYDNDEGGQYRLLTRLGQYCLRKGWIDDPRETDIPFISPVTVLDWMIEEFELQAYPTEMQRDMVAVRYDLALRELEIRYDAYYFASDIDIVFTSQVKEYDFPGVEVVASTERVYSTDYAAHLLGRVSSMNATEWEHYKTIDGYEMDDKVGKEGAESAFESYLRGEEGIRVTESNSQGDVMSAYWETEPVPGENVVLTLDIDLQKKVEDSLAYWITAENDKNVQGGACVVIEVETGAVLAAGSYPTFSLATYGEDLQENLENPSNPLFHRAFMGNYAPGSTFKMITGIAALEEGITEPKTTIRDSGPFEYYQDYQPACWIYNQYRGTHGNQTVADAIKNSCNYYFYETGIELGIGRIQEYATMFGLGVSTGIELQERTGAMAGPEYTESLGQTWYEGATLSVAIGQENSSFSPLQLAGYIATMANGGTYQPAHLLQEVKSGDFSQVTHSYDYVAMGNDLELEPENVNAIHQGMRSLITEGSVAGMFTRLESLGITSAGKTGTAQLTNESTGTSNSVFVCFAPYDNPEIALAVIVEKSGSGALSATITADILEYYFSSAENRDEIRQENTLIP